LPSSSAFLEPVHDFAEALIGDSDGCDRLAAGRFFGQLGDIHVAEGRQDQRTRNRGRGHHQHVRRGALGRQPQPLVNAEPVLLVDHSQGEVPVHHRFLEQGVGADHDLGLSIGDALEQLGAFLALGAGCEHGNLDTGRFGHFPDRGVVLAGEDLGRGHQHRLASGFDGIGHGQHRHSGLAGADITLQQPQHPVLAGHVGEDFFDSRCLASRQGKRQCTEDRLAQPAFRDNGMSRQLAQCLAHKSQRQLARQQLVIGQPAARRCLRFDIDLRFGMVQFADRVGERGKAVLAYQVRIGPLWKLRQEVQRRLDRSAQHLWRQAGGQRIDRFDQRKAVRVRFQGDMVGMDHRRSAVEPFDLAADQHGFALRQDLLEPLPLGMKEGQGQFTGIVMDEHPVRRVSAARR
jgi:hypothetical protein